MVNVTIEYMILIPLLILQIFLLPFAASMMMNYWSTSSETIALQDAASQLGSAIQQLYLFVNNPALSSATVTNDLGIPAYINGYAYTGTATLTSVFGSGSEQTLNLTLSLTRTSVSASAIVVLGQNAQWNSSLRTFTSNSASTSINAHKYSNSMILLYFAT
ncbi:MAG: hypothetical protein ABSG33_09285 [Candidatus Bathyarchaeia archaeon]